MRIKYMSTCFGCCELRAAVIAIAALNLIFGLYDVVDFSLRAYYGSKDKFDFVECMVKNATSIGSAQKQNRNNWTSIVTDRGLVLMPASSFQSPFGVFESGSRVNTSSRRSNPCVSQRRRRKYMSKIYQDTAFAHITVGLCDLAISVAMLIVVVLRKHNLRVFIYIAAVWGFVMGFLVFLSLAVTIILKLPVESALYFLTACIEVFCSYVVLSYFKRICRLVELGIAPQTVFVDAEAATPSEMHYRPSGDQAPILGDQDDN